MYANKIESIVPQFDLEGGSTNKLFKFSEEANGYEYYGEPTEEKNGLTITIPAKKHHKEQYLDSVRSQLLYFNDVLFKIQEDGIDDEQVIDADVVYEDDYIILSNNSYYSKPHILLNRVNYGYINFDELELPAHRGNIAIKVAPDEVDITPSRESLIWNEVTKNKILERFNQVVDIATSMIQNEMDTTDFWDWVKICCQLSSRYGDHNTDSIVGKLSGIVDIKSVKPKYADTDIRFEPDLFAGTLEIRLVEFVQGRKGADTITKIRRKDVAEYISQYHHLPVYFQGSRVSNRKDKFLLHTLPDNSNGFLLIKPASPDVTDTEELRERCTRYVRKDSILDNDKLTEDEEEQAIQDRIDKVIKLNKKFAERITQVWDLVKASSLVQDYEAIEVPADFTGTEDEEESVVTDEVNEEASLSHDARRKLQGKTVIHTPRLLDGGHWKNDLVGTSYEFQKLEIPIKLVDTWDSKEIYYGNEADRPTLELTAYLTRLNPTDHREARVDNTGFSSQSWAQGKHTDDVYGLYCGDAYRCTHFFKNPDLKLIKVSKSNVRLYKDFNHVSKFYHQFKNGLLTMSNILIKWNTARLMMETMHKLEFLTNLSFAGKQQAQFMKFRDYVRDNYRAIEEGSTVATEEVVSKLTGHLDTVQAFQEKVASGQYSAEQLGQIAMNTWKTDKITDACSIDLELLTEFKELVEWAEPLVEVFNRIPLLTGRKQDKVNLNLIDYSVFKNLDEYEISEELEKSLKFFMIQKGINY